MTINKAVVAIIALLGLSGVGVGVYWYLSLDGVFSTKDAIAMISGAVFIMLAFIIADKVRSIWP